MTQDSRSPELDPKLEEWLTEARECEVAPSAGIDELLAGVEQDIESASQSRLFWLRSRPTWLRRSVAWIASASVIGVGGALLLREDFARYPALHMAVALGSLGVLLALSIHQALRPLHQPPLAAWAKAAMVVLTLASTFALALFSPSDAGDPEIPAVLRHVSPCLFYGLLLGLPVYGVLRLLSRVSGRGPSLAPLLGGCAAGLAGNLVLQLHCPRNDPEHLMLGHFAVVLVFVAGLGIVQLIVRDRT